MIRAAIGSGWIAGIAVLLALGVWQVERRAWKRDLIARVDARLHAPPVPPPLRARPDDAYARVAVSGRYLPGRDTFVQAVTARGPGWWVLTPLRTADGRLILVNRGFASGRSAPPSAQTRVTGLLRLSEPGGGFLRSNDPAADRWYSRDVAAIAARRGLGPVAPYFIDADAASPASSAQPVGGLTVVRFSNNHLVYALTWFTLAAMTLAGFLYWLRLGSRAR
ncbi:MAG TPA: SURF1 family protein [Sphingomonas sp.]|jgi:surfeit locus 1 family protein|nr:SURF1 family protein [Sphingomonas sp.]